MRAPLTCSFAWKAYTTYHTWKMVNLSSNHVIAGWTDGLTLNDFALLRTLPLEKSYSFSHIQLELEGSEELSILQQFLSRNTFPELRSISVDYDHTRPGALALPPLPRLEHIEAKRLVFLSRPDALPSLCSLRCDAYLNQRRVPRASREEFCTLLSSCRNANDFNFRYSFFPRTYRFVPADDHIAPFVMLRSLSAEDEWDYLPDALAHIAVTPSARLDIIAHTNIYEFDLKRKGFWLDILPSNHAVTLPMLSNTRALRLATNLFAPDEPDVRVPLTNGAIIGGAADPLGLDALDARGSWFITVPNCHEFSEELVPKTLAELPSIIDCTKLVSLEMHTVPYISPDRSVNEWLQLLERMTALERLEVGGIRALELVFDAFLSTQCSILPALRQLVLCLGILPDEERLEDLVGLFTSTCVDLAAGREPLELLQLRIPPPSIGRLAQCPCLMEDTEAQAKGFVRLASRYCGRAEVMRQYCPTCHDGHPAVFEAYEDVEMVDA